MVHQRVGINHGLDVYKIFVSVNSPSSPPTGPRRRSFQPTFSSTTDGLRNVKPSQSKLLTSSTPAPAKSAAHDCSAKWADYSLFIGKTDVAQLIEDQSRLKEVKLNTALMINCAYNYCSHCSTKDVGSIRRNFDCIFFPS